MKRIYLTENQYAIVDECDFELLNSFKWRYMGRYVVRHQRKNEYVKLPDRKLVSMHTMIMSPSDGFLVDHINHNTMDNRRCNLRIATAQQNAFNRRKTSAKTHSKYKGVSFYKKSGKWTASIKVNSKNIYLGCFGEEREAADRYIQAAKAYQGNFALA